MRTLMHLSKQYVMARRIFLGVELDHALKPFTKWEKAQVQQYHAFYSLSSGSVCLFRA